MLRLLLLIIAALLRLSAGYCAPFIQNYNFPSIPVELGVKHIHLMEHMGSNYEETLPSFQLCDVYPPHMQPQGGGYASILFRYKTLYGKRIARLFTSNRMESHMVLWEDNHKEVWESLSLGDLQSGKHFDLQTHRPVHLLSLKIRPLTAFGHSLLIHNHVLQPALVEQQLHGGCIAPSLESVHYAILQGYAAHNLYENENFALYRQLVDAMGAVPHLDEK